MSVYIWAATWDDYSAMRGPCPKGFHVWTKSEWELIINSWVAFSAWNTTWWANFSTYLKMPAWWYRTWEWASVSWSNDMWYYWTCTQYNSTYNTYSNYGLYFRNSNWLSGISVSSRNWCIWAMIRWIKDVPVEPDSSWTTLISSWEDWIYHSATLWLISMVYSWFVYTIADKNVGATTVYNFNDTLSEANCWKFFQMWNNYPFPYSWTLTTSSTQVNATNYWPGNYYSSSTFITWSSWWDSSQNKDLWWWETWIQQTPKELKSAYIGECVGNWATQWPAPSGFHIPLNTEWQAVKDIWTGLGGWSSDWTNFWIALKLPFAGYRDYSSADVSHQGSDGCYWSSSPSSNTNLSRGLNFSLSTSIYAQDYWYMRTCGLTVRCFKNFPTVPTSSWTKLYWTSIESWWIFWSSTEWLISMSSDWTNWITIADKNLWATTVRNSGDTLSESNCGKYYQRWNNYGFPRTWTIANQSTTQVDASNYWPWNYYSSDTFIKYSWRWDSTDNWNLWWWEDGNVPVR